jgi:ATP-dependent DNA helicase RecQ
MDAKHKLLKKYWGYDTFRPLQEDIADAVIGGRDTIDACGDLLDTVEALQ